MRKTREVGPTLDQLEDFEDRVWVAAIDAAAAIVDEYLKLEEVAERIRELKLVPRLK